LGWEEETGKREGMKVPYLVIAVEDEDCGGGDGDPYCKALPRATKEFARHDENVRWVSREQAK